ncbi:MAG: phosphohydrolase [Polyangia bacterium]|jgi:hypothetical protein|nr:phosphohydrolase [Polyangia bacterium]
MSWIQTFTGKQFYPLAARVEDIDVRDIAHSLSLQSRFNGHCLRFYSVAEHSVRVSRVVPASDALWGLLHDAAEAYIGDLPRPVKANAPEFRGIEDRLLLVVAEAFGLPWPMPEAVRLADDRLLSTEARDLMAPHPASWNLREEPLQERIEPIGWEAAEDAFLVRFEELGGRGQGAV